MPAEKPGLKASVLGDKRNQLDPDEIRLIYDERGNLTGMRGTNLVGMGQVDNTFEIRHRKMHIVQGVDSLDLRFVDEVLESKEIRDWLKPLDSKSRFFKEAFENVFLLLFTPDPTLERVMQPSQVFLMRLLMTIMTAEEFEELSRRCEMNVARAAAAAKTIVTVLDAAIDQADLVNLDAAMAVGDDMQDMLEELRNLIDKHSCGQATEGGVDGAGAPSGSGDEPCQECGGKHKKLRPKTAAELGLNAEQARKRLREIAEKMSELNAKMHDVLEKHADKIKAAIDSSAKDGTGQAAKAAKAMEEVATAFGTDPGKLAKIPIDEILKLSEQYETNKEVAALLDQLGRMHKLARKAMSAIKKPVENMQQEPMVLDSDISRLMPHEFIAARHPKLRTDFKKRLLEGEAECFDTEGEEPVNRGPLILCKDTSVSMSGAPNTWASALYLAIAAVMAKQRRESVLINFSSPGQVKTSEFRLGEKFTKYIEEASFMFNGGTCFETPLNLALDYISKSEFNKADILFISDGICAVSKKFLEKFNKVKAEKQFKVVTVLINIKPGDVAVVKSFSDTVKFLSDMQKDEDVLNTVFAL